MGHVIKCSIPYVFKHKYIICLIKICTLYLDRSRQSTDTGLDVNVIMFTQCYVTHNCIRIRVFELDMNACCLCCIATLIAGFTFLFTGLTSVNACDLQHVTRVAQTIRCHPRRHWGRHFKYTTPQGHIVTLSCILILCCSCRWWHWNMKQDK